MNHSHSVAEVATGILATVSSAAVVVAQSRIDPDIVAVLGAGLAAVIAVFEARKKDRSLSHTISVLIASAIIGWTAPGLVIWFGFPAHFHTLIWQGWAALGFCFGLLGWFITAWLLSQQRLLPSILSALARRLFSLPPKADVPPKDDRTES